MRLVDLPFVQDRTVDSFESVSAIIKGYKSQRESNGNFYQDLIVSDESTDMTFTLINRQEITESSVGGTISADGSQGDKAVIKLRDGKYGPELKIYGGCPCQINGRDIPRKSGAGVPQGGQQPQRQATQQQPQRQASAPSGNLDDFIETLTAAQDISVRLASRAANKLGVKVGELPPNIYFAPNAIIMGARDAGVRLRIEPSDSGMPQSSQPPSEPGPDTSIADDDIPF
jgi:hypothetical protein